MYLIFNGLDLRELGVRIKEIHFDSLPKRKFKELSLDRYNGDLYTDFGTFEPLALDVECSVVDNFNMENIKKIKNIFKGGKGELKISLRPNITYNARLVSNVDFIEVVKDVGNFLLSFKLYPFGFLDEGKKQISIVSGGSKIVNLGNYESCPKFAVVNPTSSMKINVNGVEMAFLNCKVSFVVDCEMEEVYGLDNKNVNLNSYMKLESDFIKLKEGENNISFAGASEMKLVPNWVEI